MTEEDLKKKGRLATAVVAGSALTAGMLGIGAAPAMADEEAAPEDPENVEETEEEGAEDEVADGDDSGDDSGDDADEGGEDDGDVEVTAEDPTQDEAENTVAIPEVDGVVYTVDGESVSGTVDVPEGGLEIEAETEEGYTWAGEAPEGWTFQYSEDVGDAEEEPQVTDEDDEDENGEEADLEEVTPEPPARYDNTIEVPEVEGVAYEVEGEDVSGTTIELEEDQTVSILAVPEEGYEFPEDAETFWTESWQAGFEDLWPIDPPEGWEVDEDRWYANVPEENLPEGYADWILDHADGANQNADGSQEFESDTQVYAGPGTDYETLGDLFPTDGAVWWGYLEDEDFWMIVHQYTGAVGFLNAEDHLGEDPPEDDDDDDDDEGEDERQNLDDELGIDPEDAPDGTNPHVTTQETPIVDAEGNEVGYVSEGIILPITATDSVWPAAPIARTADEVAQEEYFVPDYNEYLEPWESDEDDDDNGEDDSSGPFGSFEADATEVAPGDDITLTATGLDAGEEIEISLNPTLAEVTADDNGEFTVTVTIPEDTEPGEYELTAQSLDREVSATIDITVVEPTGAGAGAPGDKAEGAGAPGGYGPALAETGADAQHVGLFAGLLTALGAGFVAFANRAKFIRRKGA